MAQTPSKTSIDRSRADSIGAHSISDTLSQNSLMGTSPSSINEMSIGPGARSSDLLTFIAKKERKCLDLREGKQLPIRISHFIDRFMTDATAFLLQPPCFMQNYNDKKANSPHSRRNGRWSSSAKCKLLAHQQLHLPTYHLVTRKPEPRQVYSLPSLPRSTRLHPLRAFHRHILHPAQQQRITLARRHLVMVPDVYLQIDIRYQ